jgi:hypothetical protein
MSAGRGFGRRRYATVERRSSPGEGVSYGNERLGGRVILDSLCQVIQAYLIEAVV